MSSGLEGLRALVVEDIFLIAGAPSALLRECGCDTVGPVAHLNQALDLAPGVGLDGAILDIELGGEPRFPINTALRQRGVPYFFVTGYSDELLPAEYRVWEADRYRGV